MQPEGRFIPSLIKQVWLGVCANRLAPGSDAGGLFFGDATILLPIAFRLQGLGSQALPGERPTVHEWRRLAS